MESKQLIDDKDIAVAYVLCKSVIDHTKLELDELIYLVSETLSQRQRSWVEADAGTLKDSSGQELKDADANPIKIKKKFLSVDGITPMKRDPKIEANDPTNWVEWTIDAENTLGGSPPSIVEVEAYIEELIRVWKKLREDRTASV